MTQQAPYKSCQTADSAPIDECSKCDSLSPCMSHCHCNCHGQCLCHKNVTSSAHSQSQCRYRRQQQHLPGPGSSPSEDWISRSAAYRSDASLLRLLQLMLCGMSCRLAVQKHWQEGRCPAVHGTPKNQHHWVMLHVDLQRTQG